jgi:hypothetical protein
MPLERGGGGGSCAQKREPVPLPDTVGAKMKSSTPTDQGRADEDTQTVKCSLVLWAHPRDSPSQGYVKPQVNQVEDSLKENPILYLSHDAWQ